MGEIGSRSVTVEMTPHDALREAPHAIARTVGSQWFMLWMVLGGTVAGLLVPALIISPLMALLWQLNPVLAVAAAPLPTVLLVFGALIGYDQGSRWAMRTHQARFLANLHERGTPSRLTTQFSLAEDALEIAHERTAYRVAYAAISQIVRGPNSWLLQVDLTSFCLPIRAFADDAAQREFIADLLRRITPEARRRSEDALAFLDTP